MRSTIALRLKKTQVSEELWVWNIGFYVLRHCTELILSWNWVPPRWATLPNTARDAPLHPKSLQIVEDEFEFKGFRLIRDFNSHEESARNPRINGDGWDTVLESTREVDAGAGEGSDVNILWGSLHASIHPDAADSDKVRLCNNVMSLNGYTTVCNLVSLPWDPGNNVSRCRETRRAMWLTTTSVFAPAGAALTMAARVAIAAKMLAEENCMLVRLLVEDTWVVVEQGALRTLWCVLGPLYTRFVLGKTLLVNIHETGGACGFILIFWARW